MSISCRNAATNDSWTACLAAVCAALSTIRRNLDSGQLQVLTADLSLDLDRDMYRRQTAVEVAFESVRHN